MSSFDLYLDLALIFFLLLVVLNYRVHRSVLYPPFIFCAMWLLDLVVIRSHFIELDPIHGNTLAIVAAGAASFSVGGLLAGFAPREWLSIHIRLVPTKAKRTSDFLRNTLMIVLLCGLPILFLQTLQLSKLGGGGSSILTQARVELIVITQSGELRDQPFVLNYFPPIAIFTSLLFATGKKDWKFWVVTVVSFIGCILSTGRGGLLVLIAGLSAISLLQRKQESLRGAIKFLRFPIAFFVALFIGLIFIDKNTADMTGGIAEIVSNSTISYIVGPLAGLDSVVQNPSHFTTTTSHTFQSFLKIAGALHITTYTMPPMIDSYVFVPFPMNVYTVFKFYFLELGIVGTLALLLFIGLLHCLLYLKASRGGRFSTYLFANFMYPVLLVTYDDQYGLYLRVIAFGLVYFILGSVPFRLFPANWQRKQYRAAMVRS